jgi:hypothetical protein
MTGVLAVTAGTAALPAITPSGDPNTGIFSPGADQVAISTNGSERLRILSDGKLGLGTSAPQELLHVNNVSAATTRIRLTNATTGTGTFDGLDLSCGSTGVAALIQWEQQPFQIFTNNGSAVDPRLTITAAGAVGIGTTSPSARLDVSNIGGNVTGSDFKVDTTNGSATVTVGRLSSTASDHTKFLVTDRTGNMQFESYSGVTRFGSGASEAARFESGRLLIGTSSARSNIYHNADSITPQIQFETQKGDYSGGLSIINCSASGYPGVLTLGQSYTNTLGGNGLTPNGEPLGIINFVANDGTNLRTGAFIRANIDATSGSGDVPTRLIFATTADGASSPTEKLCIFNNGEVLADGRNGTSASIFYSILPSPGTSRNHFFGNTVGIGTWALQGNGTSTWTSDERRKKNIEPTRDGYLEDLAQLRVVKYNWNVQSDDEPKELGLIAQEVEQVFPGLVVEADEPQEGDDYRLKSVKFSVLPFMLLKALQEAAAKIEALEAKVAALEGV